MYAPFVEDDKPQIAPRSISIQDMAQAARLQPHLDAEWAKMRQLQCAIWEERKAPLLVGVSMPLP